MLSLIRAGWSFFYLLVLLLRPLWLSFLESAPKLFDLLVTGLLPAIAGLFIEQHELLGDPSLPLPPAVHIFLQFSRSKRRPEAIAFLGDSYNRFAIKVTDPLQIIR